MHTTSANTRILFSLITKQLFIFLLIILSSLTKNLSAQNWNQLIKTVASDRGLNDRFGYSVAIDGDYAIVGAYLEDNLYGSGGQSYKDAGAAYILSNKSGKWTVVQKITSKDNAVEDMFGYSVSISGNIAVVGSPGKNTVITGGTVVSDVGAAYIFENQSGTWTQVNKIMASDKDGNDEFGTSVGISGDFIIVGAPYEDQALNGLTTSNKGSAYIFTKGVNGWNQLQKIQKIVGSQLSTGANFGWTVAISGDYAIVGAPREQVIISGSLTKDVGAAYIWKKQTSGNWSELKTLTASDRTTADEFGNSVAISGDFAIVGAMLEQHNEKGADKLVAAGSAYIFEKNSDKWTQSQKIVAPDRETDDMFGVAVSISGEYTIIGAHKSGSAYVFRNIKGTWTHASKLVASDSNGGDMFGYAAAISGDHALVGAYFDDKNANGTNSLIAAGSAYFFKNCIVRKRDTQTVCNSLTWIDGKTYMENNSTATYTFLGGAASGCDSIVELYLTVNKVSDISTTVSGTTISANNSLATYRWLNCSNNYSSIPGQTNSSFKPEVNGSYAVELTENQCIDTSLCLEITTLGVIENEMGWNFLIFPNPTNDNISIDLGKVSSKSELVIMDFGGHEIEHKLYFNSQKFNVSMPELPGIYIMNIISDGKKAVIKVVKK